MLLEFNFEDDCNELQIQFSMDAYENEAKVELFSDMKVAIASYLACFSHKIPFRCSYMSIL